jgi:hypothetical protein
MMSSREDAVYAGRLIQFALQPKAMPFDNHEYRELLREYEDRADFRSLVQAVAEGLGLAVLLVNERGMFLGTDHDSVFSQSPSAFRSGQVSGDDRLLDGLVELAIAATLFPRQRDLDDDVLEARPPITIADIDGSLRELVEALKQQLPEEPDTDADRLDQGLWEAWRVYESRPSYRKTGSGRPSANSTYRIIEQHLDRLCELGCFVAERHRDPIRYRPTLRYQVLVQELAATKLYRRVTEAMCGAERGEPAPQNTASQEAGE